MAEPLLYKLRNQLIYVTSRQRDSGINLVTGLEDELENLLDNLRLLQLQLNNAENTRSRKDRAVADWIEKLEDLAYEMDDLLDEWNIQIHKYQIEKTQIDNLQDKVRSFLRNFGLCRIQVSLGCEIALKIKELNNRLNMILVESCHFNFVASYQLNREIGQVGSSSVSFVDEFAILGRENDKDMLLKQLLSREEDDNTGIVSIVGTAGIGKTALAQLVYNDKEVCYYFHYRLWVWVSGTFDLKRIAKEILGCFGKSCPDYLGLESLLELIRSLSYGARFLLVLDDVWTEDHNEWEPILSALKRGSRGSIILMTTRSELVARTLNTYYLHSLNLLSSFDCWRILRGIAFCGTSVKESEKLEEIGFEISRKCKGLPLAAKVLGGLLRFKYTVEQWQNILESEIWELEEAATDIFPAIYLSYKELSPEKKHCFLYCATFPKDFHINVEQLIRLWMAQGYIRCEGIGEEFESEGYWYFEHLAMRSFFMNLERDPHNEDQIIKCTMHDIIHDFAQHLLNGRCLIVKKLDEAKQSSCRKVHHLTWFHGDVSTSSMAGHVGNLRSFRSFNCINVDSDLFDCVKHVRTFSLYGAWLEVLPSTVGKLINLRYLDFSRNSYLKELPEEICDLYYLETLDVTDCNKLTQLPQRIGNLVNLKYLLNSGTNIKQGLEKLTSLRVLKELKVGRGYNQLECLTSLTQLGGEISIEFFGEVNEVNFCNERLRKKTRIRGLVFKFYESVVRISKLPQYLEHLSTYFYPESALPNCIMSLHFLRELNISFGGVSSLPELWKLRSLEILQLFALRDIEVLGREFLGITENPAGQCAFPRLKKLKFSHLQNLRTWDDLGEGDESSALAVMPRLRELNFNMCRVLKMLPDRLLGKATLLEVLDLRLCAALTKRYNRSANGWNHVSNIPKVLIDGSRQVPLAH